MDINMHAHQPTVVQAALPGGLRVAQDGYALELEKQTFTAFREMDLRFRVFGPDGQPVTRYDIVHERPLHLIVVRRDFAHYQHVHPTVGTDGSWAVKLDLPLGGIYRVFADFRTQGKSLTLGADIFIAGLFIPATERSVSSLAGAGKYQVSLSLPSVAKLAGELAFSVRREGQPVKDLVPHLGALGHLVALREGDMAFLHIHPIGVVGAGPEIRFHAAFPSPGRYHLFLEFNHGGEVRRVSFTVNIPRQGPVEN